MVYVLYGRYIGWYTSLRRCLKTLCYLQFMNAKKTKKTPLKKDKNLTTGQIGRLILR